MIRLLITDLGHGFDEREVFSSVNFAFDGTCLAITGPNGSGKSTLVRIIAGLLTPTCGEVVLEIDGVPVPRDRARDLVGLVAPDVRLYNELTVCENLCFLSCARGHSVSSKRVAEVLEQVELSERADDLLRDLSTGLRQRACLAAALINDPHVLLLDEPCTNLDTKGVQMVRETVEQQADRGIVVLATNSSDDLTLADARLNLGSLCQ